jgi:flagellar biosynthesis protein FlhG
MSDQAQGLRVLADQLRGDNAMPIGEPHSLLSSAHAGLSRGSVHIPRHDSNNPALPEHPGAVVRFQTRRDDVVPARHARILAVTSGKGGVGKSNFSANLSVALGQMGRRVIMMDADMGLANAHLLLGSSPQFTLEHVMRGEKTVAEVLHPVAENVQLIAGGSGITELADLKEDTREACLTGLRDLDTSCDLIVIDTGAGVANNVLGFLCAVAEIIVVTTPEPTAITNAYATIKVVSRQNPEARLMLVVNMVHSSGEGDAVAERLKTIARQFLKIELEYLGFIPTDPAVQKAVRIRTPFVSSAPGCRATTELKRVVASLGYTGRETVPQTGVEGFLTGLQRFFGRRGGK